MTARDAIRYHLFDLYFFTAKRDTLDDFGEGWLLHLMGQLVSVVTDRAGRAERSNTHSVEDFVDFFYLFRTSIFQCVIGPPARREQVLNSKNR